MTWFCCASAQTDTLTHASFKGTSSDNWSKAVAKAKAEAKSLS